MDMNMHDAHHDHGNLHAHEHDHAHAHMDHTNHMDHVQAHSGGGKMDMNMHKHANMDMGMGMDMGMSMMMMMMPRWFTRKTEVHFMFENLKIDSVQGIALAMVTTVILLLLYEFVNFSLSARHVAAKNRKDESRITHLTHTLLKMLSVLIGYILMLFVMTFNIWLLISVVLGAGIAHLLIRPLLYRQVKDGKRRVPETDGSCCNKQILLHDYVIQEEETCGVTCGPKTSNDIAETNHVTDASPLVAESQKCSG